MYAIIKTGGIQFKVEPGMKLLVPGVPGKQDLHIPSTMSCW